MTYIGEEKIFLDFTGGLASSSYVMSIAKNQATLLRNVYISTEGGIEKRRGNTAFNSSAMVSGSTVVTGLGYYKQGDGDEWLMSIAGTKLFKSDSLDGTMDDITGALTITTGQDNIWTHTQMNDLSIFVGGAPDAPIKWNGTGNGAVLGGTPPSGRFGFTHNNRFFIGSTAANPSRIAWSILGNPEDWSGTGSGTQDIEANDGDVLVGAAPLNTDVVLLFKENSIHQFVTRTSPFPSFPLFRGVGAVGKNAIVLVDGVAYFITPRGRMKATDGSTVISFPDSIDDIWDGLSRTRLKFINGVRYTGEGIDHIIWMCSNGSSTTNNLAIVWDLLNKCWLQHTSGYKANVSTKTQAGVLYTGHYNGVIYKQDVSNVYRDNSETSPGAIDALWRSGWNLTTSMEKSFHPFRLNVGMTSQTAGNLSTSYGFDFAEDQTSEDLDMRAPGMLWDVGIWDVDSWGGQMEVIRRIFIKGRGLSFQVAFENNVADQVFKLQGYSVSGKDSSVKAFQIN